jgi:hypothetical protein
MKITQACIENMHKWHRYRTTTTLFWETTSLQRSENNTNSYERSLQKKSKIREKEILTNYQIKLLAVWRIRICMFSGLLDPDPLVRGTDADTAPNPSITNQK